MDVYDVARSAQRAVARQNPRELRQRALIASFTGHSFRQDQYDAHRFACRCSLCGAGSSHSFRNTGALSVIRELLKLSTLYNEQKPLTTDSATGFGVVTALLAECRIVQAFRANLVMLTSAVLSQGQ